MVKFSTFGALAVLSLASQVLAQQTVKVMPFGASIVSVSFPTDSCFTYHNVLIMGRNVGAPIFKRN